MSIQNVIHAEGFGWLAYHPRRRRVGFFMSSAPEARKEIVDYTDASAAQLRPRSDCVM
jgi:hypothetical protein